MSLFRRQNNILNPSMIIASCLVNFFLSVNDGAYECVTPASLTSYSLIKSHYFTSALSCHFPVYFKGFPVILHRDFHAICHLFPDTISLTIIGSHYCSASIQLSPSNSAKKGTTSPYKGVDFSCLLAAHFRQEDCGKKWYSCQDKFTGVSKYGSWKGHEKVARSATGILVSRNIHSLFRVPLRRENFWRTTTRNSARAQRGHCAHFFVNDTADEGTATAQ